MNKLFVYGIFLSERNRWDYGMTNPQYATVKGYATFGGRIVEAVYVGDVWPNACLTGLIVDADPTQWKDLDALEYGYDRIRITTTSGEEAWMYVAKLTEENHYAEA